MDRLYFRLRTWCNLFLIYSGEPRNFPQLSSFVLPLPPALPPLTQALVYIMLYGRHYVLTLLLMPVLMSWFWYTYLIFYFYFVELLSPFRLTKIIIFCQVMCLPYIVFVYRFKCRGFKPHTCAGEQHLGNESHNFPGRLSRSRPASECPLPPTCNVILTVNLWLTGR